MPSEILVPGAIFDGDDTLWRTQELYETAKEEFLKHLEQAGFPRQESAELLERQDIDNVFQFGFSRTRFPTSMVMVYKNLCTSYERSVSRQILEELRKIGASVFQKTPTIIPGARRLLKSLKATHRVILLTKGDREIQEERISSLNLNAAFDAIYIVANKKPEHFERIALDQQLEKAESWSIGNSLHSDALPAIKAGLRCIWIPVSTWQYEDRLEAPPPSGVRIAHSLKEVETILRGK